MISNTGLTPPLHRRCDKDKALEYIRNRYSHMKKRIAKQVEVLQKDKNFLVLCNEYYKMGYPDWTILIVIYNCMHNWICQEFGCDDPRLFTETTKEKEILLMVNEKIMNTIYPADKFIRQEMDSNLKLHFLAVFKTYGFELRRIDYNPAVLERFLRERMKHFDFDLPHDSLFGKPAGNWP